MIEITRQLTGLAKKIDGIVDVVDVLEWVLDRPGLYCSVSARTDNHWLIEVGGLEVQSIRVELGQWVVFDGDRFHALTDEEFEARGYKPEVPAKKAK